MIPEVLGGTLLGWSAVTSVTSAIAIARAARSAAHRPAPAENAPAEAPSVCLVRPCTGDDDSLESALLSTAAVCRPGLRVVLSVASAADPAWPIVRRCARMLAETGHHVEARVATTPAYNQKVGQLAAVTRDAPEAVFVCVDADVDLTGCNLAGLVSGLQQDPSAGALWLPPAEVAAPRSVGDRVSGAVLGASLHAFGLLGELDRDGLVGKVFAVRATALRDAGGFDALTDHLGEDMELARRLRGSGWRTQMAPGMARSVAADRDLSTILARYTRWLLVIRAQRPALLSTYPLILAAAPLQLLAAAMLSFVAPQAALCSAALVLVARAAVGITAASLQSQRRRVTPGRWLLADLALLVVFLRALGPARVTWRSRTLHLGPGGRLCAAR